MSPAPLHFLEHPLLFNSSYSFVDYSEISSNPIILSNLLAKEKTCFNVFLSFLFFREKQNKFLWSFLFTKSYSKDYGRFSLTFKIWLLTGWLFQWLFMLFFFLPTFLKSLITRLWFTKYFPGMLKCRYEWRWSLLFVNLFKQGMEMLRCEKVKVLWHMWKGQSVVICVKMETKTPLKDPGGEGDSTTYTCDEYGWKTHKMLFKVPLPASERLTK